LIFPVKNNESRLNRLRDLSKKKITKYNGQLTFKAIQYILLFLFHKSVL